MMTAGKKDIAWSPAAAWMAARYVENYPNMEGGLEFFSLLFEQYQRGKLFVTEAEMQTLCFQAFGADDAQNLLSTVTALIKKYFNERICRAPLQFSAAGDLYFVSGLAGLRSLALCLQERSRSNWARKGIFSTSAAELKSLYEKAGWKLTEKQWQATQALEENSVMVLAGGPGTGKTTSVVTLLRCWVDVFFKKHGHAPRIALCAPTGRAAGRMSESIRENLANNLGLTGDWQAVDGILTALPNALTLHRLLGVRGYGSQGQSRYYSDNPLPYDLIVMDEASMVGFDHWCQLLEAIPEQGHLVLVGDANQLPPVNSENIFSDIVRCFAGKNNLVTLDKSHRAKMPYMADLSGSVLCNDAKSALAILTGNGILQETVDLEKVCAGLWDFDKHSALARFESGATSSDEQSEKKLRMRLDELMQSVVLCLYNSGPLGVAAVNSVCINKLPGSRDFRAGASIVITENDYELQLFNGDRAVIFHDGNDVPWALFPKDAAGVRKIQCELLKKWQFGFALTVHKSQGSEFKNVHFLVEAREHSLFDSSMIYTGITRAREKLQIFGSKEHVSLLVGNHLGRQSLLPALFAGEISAD